MSHFFVMIQIGQNPDSPAISGTTPKNHNKLPSTVPSWMTPTAINTNPRTILNGIQKLLTLLKFIIYLYIYINLMQLYLLLSKINPKVVKIAY